MSVTIDIDQCMGCGACTHVCPKGLLALTDASSVNARGVRHVRLTDACACVECGACEHVCPSGVLHVAGSAGGYDLIQKDRIPPHAGCALGCLARALADAASALDITDRLVLFKLKGSDVNLDVESYDYVEGDHFADGMAYKAAHPKKIVVIICSSSKRPSTALNEERLRSLTDECVTLVNTLNWFEADEDLTQVTAGGSRILEEIARQSAASFVARSFAETPRETAELTRHLTRALRLQMEGRPFTVVQMVYPCFYRVSGRPQAIMPYERLEQVRAWFNALVRPHYAPGVLKDVDA